MPKNIFKEAIIKYGFKPQILMLVEECSELSFSCCKLLREMNKNERIFGFEIAPIELKTECRNVIEEIADVEIMIEQMKLIFYPYIEELVIIKREKLERLATRLEIDIGVDSNDKK